MKENDTYKVWDAMIENIHSNLCAKERNKAILILDEPIDCNECPLHDLSSMKGDKLCMAHNMKWIETQNEGKKPEWCPLRPFPERKEVRYTDPLFGEVENLTNIGYNKCLDEILGETE